MPNATITEILRYPVKGLSPDRMTEASLQPGQGLSDDRRFAIALKSTQFDPDNPVHIHKTGFAMLMKNERLAKLDIAYEEGDQKITIYRGGKQVTAGSLTDYLSKTRLEDFFDAYLAKDFAGDVHLVEGKDGHMFSDHANRVLSIINMNSVAELSRVTKTTLDPVRFRGNIHLEGPEAWEEFNWVGQEIQLGEARLKVTARIDRCGATNVDPTTGVRDMNIPKTLMGAWGHIDFGVYAEVLTPGVIKPGDHLTLA